MSHPTAPNPCTNMKHSDLGPHDRREFCSPPVFRPVAPQPYEAKKPVTAWLLFLFLGGFSAHRFYLGQTGRAVAQLLTLQYLTIAIWIDLFTLANDIRVTNDRDWNAYMSALEAHQRSQGV